MPKVIKPSVEELTEVLMVLKDEEGENNLGKPFYGIVTLEHYNMMNIKFMMEGETYHVCIEDGICITEDWENLRGEKIIRPKRI